uniref:Uncharacterized protein n=1 Tax=Rhizophora mucronata TaxID=61149 RepID=A0A2P2NFD0_RHIMU
MDLIICMENLEPGKEKRRFTNPSYEEGWIIEMEMSVLSFEGP